MGRNTFMVTGASGMLGASVMRLSRARGRAVLATVRGAPLDGSVAFDLARPGAAADAVARVQPAVIIHCAAATGVDWCEDHPSEAMRVNALAAGELAAAARSEGSRLVHISTDSVFDGTRGSYREVDACSPVNVYSRTKLAAEIAVRRELGEDALIVRTSIYGWHTDGRLSAAEWFVAKLRTGERIPGFADVIFTPMFADDLAAILLALVDRGASGTLHVAGSSAVSKYDFGVRVARLFNLDPALVERRSVADASLRAPRPLDTSLDCAKVEALLDHAMPTVDAGLARFRGHAPERGAFAASL